MPLFRFEPLKDSLNHPDWEASSCKTTCYACAKTKEGAIKIVKEETRVATAKPPLGQKVRISPWGNPELVLIVPSAQMGDVQTPEGAFWIDKPNKVA